MTLNRNLAALAALALAFLVLVALAACCGMLGAAYPNGMGGDGTNNWTECGASC